MKKNVAASAKSPFTTVWIAALSVLSACGGGGGGSSAPTPTPAPPPPASVTISGTVAAGSALAGTVSVYDSSAKSQPAIASAAIGTGGQYSVAVTGLTAPFLLQATGQLGGQGPTVTLYSVATTAPGTVNITPVTSLIALNMSAGNIHSLMNGSAGSLPGLTATELNNQNGNVDKLLSSVLTQQGLSADYNFSSTPFTVGGNGYSQLLNTVTVNLATPAAVTITNNAAPGTPVTVDTEAGSPNGALNVVNGPATLPVSVTVGGTVTGLTASGLQLQDNGADTDSVATNATSFTFATSVASGAAYAVSVKAQPTGQSCTVSNGAGTAGNSNVTSVTVACITATVGRTYAVGGSVSNLRGVTLSLLLQNNGGAASNVVSILPGQSTFSFGIGLPNGTGYIAAVQQQPAGQSCTVTNGSGTVSGSNVGSINVSCTTTAQWAWISGDDSLLDTVYGTLGQAAPGNTPGGRSHATTSVDAAGNLWLFGGGYSDSSLANDLWVYNPSAGQWTWVAGSALPGAGGVYGTRGVAGSANAPGARYGAVSWTDAAGNFWLFGGQGYDSTGTQSWLNDLWEYDSATGTWMWVSGSSVGNAAGVYGTAGVAAVNNQPGARLAAFGWIDATNNLWLQGGTGFDAGGQQTTLNDLWRFDVAAGRWTWINGSKVGDASGVYGTKSVPSAASSPGARQAAATWADSAGQLWLFGGVGLDASGTDDTLNDLWRFSPASGLWTWMGGSTLVNAQGTYGAAGVAAAGSFPGARFAATSWMDITGAFWLLAGEGYDSTSSPTNIQSDIWKYDLAAGEWTWIAGANSDGGGDAGQYQVQGQPAAGNLPGARSSAMSWTDGSGSWLYGGFAASPTKPGASSYTLSRGANDLWHFGAAIFYNGTGSMTGTFTDQNNCRYPAPATIVNANVTMSTPSAGAVTITYTVPALTGLASASPTCPSYQANSGSFTVPVSVNGTVMQSLPGSFGSVNATLSGGIASGTVGFVESGALGTGTFSWTESGTFSTPAAAVTVPSLTGLTQADAAAAIIAAGLRVGIISHQNSNTVPTNGVSSQTPAANSTIASGSSVNLAVSIGPASETVPNVVGLTQAAAGNAIVDAGLSIGTVTQQFSATVPLGAVISEIPAAGGSVPTGSAIKLVTSSGPLFVAIPDVVGLSQSDATTAITGAGLTVGTIGVQTTTSSPSGSIIAETPTANSKVVSGSAVDIVTATVPSPVSVPNVLGVDQATAVSAITGAGLTVGVMASQMSATVPAGSVISQIPAAASGISSGGAVGLVVSLGAAQGIRLPAASPDAIQPGNPTSIIVHSAISLPTLVAGSVAVRQVNLAGSALGSGGPLNDGGTDGDMTAGDGVYSGTLTISPTAAGRIWLQVIANQADTPTQVVSTPIPVDILPAGMPVGPFASDLSNPDIDPGTGAEIAPDEIIACFVPQATPGAIADVGVSAGATVVSHLSTGTNCYQLGLSSRSGGVGVRSAITSIRTLPLVSMADPNFIVSGAGSACIFPVCLSDNSYKVLGLKTLNVTALRAPTIAVLDTGANFADPNMHPRLIVGPNFVAGLVATSTEAADKDDNGHGTAVVGVIAGVNPLSSLYVVKVLDKEGLGSSAWLIAAIDEVRGHQDIKVINISADFATLTPLVVWADQVGALTASIKLAEALGDIVVVAAGNDGVSMPDFPASLSSSEPGVISVSAVDDSGGTIPDTVGIFPSPEVSSNLNASIAAPGVGIITNSTNGKNSWSGTSLAAPFVSATVALVEAQYPSMSPSDVKKQILSSAVPIYYLNSDFTIKNQKLVNTSEGGRGPEGYDGRLDPVAALGAIRFTHTGFVDQNQLDVTISSASQDFVITSLFLGTASGGGGPCEARITDSCIFDMGMQTPLPAGDYLIDLSVPAGSSNDFGGEFTVTVPGLTIVSCDTPATATKVDAQHGSIFLVGSNGNQRFAHCMLRQVRFQ